MNLQARLHEFEATVSTKLERLQENIRANADKLDVMDQERRSNCLLIQVIPEKKNNIPDTASLVVELMSGPLGLSLRPADTDGGLVTPPVSHIMNRSFRLGKPRSDAEIASNDPRPILVKFVSNMNRNNVYYAKTNLKH
jgi:hypothetical protein